MSAPLPPVPPLRPTTPAYTLPSPVPPRASAPAGAKTFIVEHLDAEFETWCTLEYSAIATECALTQPVGSVKMLISGIPAGMRLPERLSELQGKGLTVEHRKIEELVSVEGKTGETGKRWRRERVCLLDPKAERELEPADGELFDAFLFGGILGDDPPQDRTGILRAKGFPGRRLGPKQMTTDTAARVTRIIACEGVPMERIPFVDDPEIAVSEGVEVTTMPFRYVGGNDGRPVMPRGMVELIKVDADRPLDLE